ncbi:MAG: gliding motility-associated C-terminal domain-containing protein [Sphingobacteriaceae bacterium]|nr:gliding motility-associated C-terminal domain-containing protein [Sphingobacteriaceae bacterium]
MGRKIFHTKQYNEGWDGKMNGRGEVVDNGIYIWKVIVTDVFKERHQFTGHITLIKVNKAIRNRIALFTFLNWLNRQTIV